MPWPFTIPFQPRPQKKIKKKNYCPSPQPPVAISPKFNIPTPRTQRTVFFSHLVTFTFPNGTTNSELGALMGATEKARSAVAWCKAKWMCMAPLLHSTVHTKDAERWRPRAGDKLLEVKSLAFKPGVCWLVFLRRNGGEKRKHMWGWVHRWDKEHHEFYICTVFSCWMILMRPTSRKPHKTKKWPHIKRLFRKNTSYKTSVQETIDTDVATIPTSHLQRVSKWPCGCRDLNLNMT